VAVEHLPEGPWQVPLAVGGGVLLMLATHTLHPPAGINALLPVTHGFGWWFVLHPVAIGAVLLVAYAVAYGRFVRWLRPRLDGP
jgi:CBS-domain-containing membrane protein